MTTLEVGVGDWEHWEIWELLSQSSAWDFLYPPEGDGKAESLDALMRDRGRIINQTHRMSELIPENKQKYETQRDELLVGIDKQAKKLLGDRVFWE